MLEIRFWPTTDFSRFQKLSHQTSGSLWYTAALHQHVENEAILIDSSPQPVFLAANGDDNFIEVPFVAELTGGPAADFICKLPPEFLHPKASGLVRDDDPTCRQSILDHAKAERNRRYNQTECAITSSGKSMATIKGITSNFCHAARSHISLDRPLNVRCPLTLPMAVSASSCRNELHSSKLRCSPDASARRCLAAIGYVE